MAKKFYEGKNYHCCTSRFTIKLILTHTRTHIYTADIERAKSIDKVERVWYPENVWEKDDADTSYNSHYYYLS